MQMQRRRNFVGDADLLDEAAPQGLGIPCPCGQMRHVMLWLARGFGQARLHLHRGIKRAGVTIAPAGR